MTFRSWLLSQHDRDDAIGRLARDTHAEIAIDCWVGDTADSLRSHMVLWHDYHPDTIMVVTAAEREYRDAVEAPA